MRSSEKKSARKEVRIIDFFSPYLILGVSCLTLISCASTDVKKPLKAETPVVQKDARELANEIENRVKRPAPDFSPPKENAADVEMEEVPLEVVESKSQQAKKAEFTSQRDSESPNGTKNNSATSENRANGKDGILVNLGGRDKSSKSKIRNGISIDLNSSNQEPSTSLSESYDGMSSALSGDNKYSGGRDAAVSENSVGGAPNNGLGNALNTIGTTYGKANKQQNTKNFPDIKDEVDEDIVARQIREAAHLETDQVLKKKLWLEYERYRSGLAD